ncbi:endonuclease/exonuclease/phosphatase family protein [Gymnodinialimonas hymeniacidonis]|uniref:endonuclease/exonuclease/phosphatase family protein n=1 Tax=Gymnodinialimonas hymeniacidonis TaxID=3126508 RepID=UPI0034C655E2
MSGRGPGTVLRDILRLEDVPAATIDIIVEAQADILALQDVDFDAGGSTIGALRDALAERGLDYPYIVSLRPNSGWPTGVDIDGDGRTDGPRDAHGYGRFNGEGGMAVLSRHPIREVRDFSDLLWQDLPDAAAAEVSPEAALPVLRLHSVAAWDIEVLIDGQPFRVLTSHASAPVFDGPEDRNGLRNADELRFWHMYLDGEWTPSGEPFEAEHFAYMGTLNLDPEHGEGRRFALLDLLSHHAVQDPEPQSPYGAATADWDDPNPGDLRVDYVLPSRSLTVLGSAVIWPEDGPLAEAAAQATDHRLVWVDVDF